MSQIKVEILLPIFYNPDENQHRQRIETQKFIDTFDELIFHFGAYSVNESLVNGEWVSETSRQRIDDQLRQVWVICEDKPEHIDFLTLLKERLMERFEQEEILMYYTTVNRF